MWAIFSFIWYTFQNYNLLFVKKFHIFSHSKPAQYKIQILVKEDDQSVQVAEMATRDILYFFL